MMAKTFIGAAIASFFICLVTQFIGAIVVDSDSKLAWGVIGAVAITCVLMILPAWRNRAWRGGVLTGGAIAALLGGGCWVLLSNSLRTMH